MLPDAATPSSPLPPRRLTDRRMGNRFSPRWPFTAQIDLADGGSLTAGVQNLSARGIALLLRRTVAPGSVLEVRLVK